MRDNIFRSIKSTDVLESLKLTLKELKKPEFEVYFLGEFTNVQSVIDKAPAAFITGSLNYTDFSEAKDVDILIVQPENLFLHVEY